MSTEELRNRLTTKFHERLRSAQNGNHGALPVYFSTLQALLIRRTDWLELGGEQAMIDFITTVAASCGLPVFDEQVQSWTIAPTPPPPAPITREPPPRLDIPVAPRKPTTITGHIPYHEHTRRHAGSDGDYPGSDDGRHPADNE